MTEDRATVAEPGRAGAVVGRGAELAAVDEVLEGAREGLAALLLEGEAGIGKTTVWREGLSRAGALGFRALSCRAAQAEARMSYTGICDLLGPLPPEAYDGLPAPQRHALDIALLRQEPEGRAPDPRALGTGVVSLVGALAAADVVLVALDDVQWLDAATVTALGFALRRLEDARVAVVATRRIGEGDGRPGPLAAVSPERVRRCRLGPMSLGALHQVIKGQLGAAPARPLLGRIARASGGNPFHALEVARALAADGPPRAGAELPVPEDMRELVDRRIRRLPRRTRDELLRASALAQPSLAAIDRAAILPAADAGVVSLHPDGRLEFAHPLLASAVYASASPARRRQLHSELAEVAGDPEERARHLARAIDGPDAELATRLEEAAARAYGRGAPEVAADLAEQAAARTPGDDLAAGLERRLAAARLHMKAGDVERATALGREVLAGGPGQAVRADTLQLLGEIEMMASPQTAASYLEDALALVGDDPRRAASLETCLGLVCMSTVQLAGAEGHLRRARELAEATGDTALLAEALGMWGASLQLAGQGVDETVLERALALEDPDRDVAFQMRPSLNVATVLYFTGELARARGLLLDLRARIVARGEESDLPHVLIHLGGTAFLMGDLATAEAEAEEAGRVAALTGQELFVTFALVVRALIVAVRGDADASREAADALASAERLGWLWGVMESRWAQGLIALSDGDAEAAAVALEPVAGGIEGVGIYDYPAAQALPDAIEALVGVGELERAARLADALAERGRALDRPWSLALSGRCRALIAAAAGDLEGAQDAAERALRDHERLPLPFELGRTLLVLGRIERRRRQRRAARETLGRALAVFEGLPAHRWAAATRGELERVEARRAPGGLTEGERRVAELAAQGLTNREIAAALFLSRRTVEANLARAYPKLGIRSRAQLAAALAAHEPG